jgi:hypothetical protein
MADSKMTESRVKAVPILWEITTQDDFGHQTVTRVAARTEAEARAALPADAPDVIAVRDVR